MLKPIFQVITKFQGRSYLGLATQRILTLRGLTQKPSFCPPNPPNLGGVNLVSPRFGGLGRQSCVTKNRLIAYLLPLTIGLFPTVAISQTLTPDGSTNTQVSPNGDISGGEFSRDGTNLFHSFSQFELSPGEIANFLSNPSIVNILGRVTGGDLSVINGLIQVTGGNSNLFLINPAGIVMGANAQLNLPADFTATTATRMGFGNNNWFNALGANDYSTLVGTPNVFEFGGLGTPGAIANAGNLTVQGGQNLSLLGGTVVSTGQLTAPGGNITVIAVPGQNLVRISQSGHLLNLEIQPSATTTSNFDPLSLPVLLTGSPDLQKTTGLTACGELCRTVDPTTGQVILTNSGLTLPDLAGTVLISGNMDASATPPFQLGGGVQILGNSVGAFGEITARGSLSGGFVQVLGIESLTFDGKVDTSAANDNRGTLLLNGANLTLSDGFPLSSTLNPDYSPSPFDPNRPANILTWGQLGDLALSNNLVVQGRGQIAIADVVGNTPGVTQNNLVNFSPSAGSLTIRSTEGSIIFQDKNDTLQTVGNAITLEAFDGIIGGNFLTLGGEVRLDAQTGSITVGQINTSSALKGGSVTLNAQQDIILDLINTQSLSNGIGGEVAIATGRFFQATDTFIDRYRTRVSISTAGGAGGGSLSIQHGINRPGTAFTVGRNFNQVNGSAGSLSTGSDNQIRGGVFLGSYRQGTPPRDIQIITSQIDPLLDNHLLPQKNLPLPLQEDAQFNQEQIVSNSLQPEIDTVFHKLEELFTGQFEDYLGSIVNPTSINLRDAQKILEQIEINTGVKPALIYTVFVPATLSIEAMTQGQAQLPSDQLELVVVTAQGQPIRKRLEGITRQQVLNTAQEFRNSVTNPRSSRGYMGSGRQLYQWLVEPLEADLQAQGINNLVFILDTGLRSLPIAALYDGQEFLVERYSVSLMPSLQLTDTSYRDIKFSQVLAMGAETFSEQNPLPAVPLELSIITNQLWPGKSFLNEAFTLENLKAQREQTPFGMIHLATHGDFQPGAPENSYIQLFNSKLRLNQLRQLGWNDPPVELLVLSACRTAMGDEEVELGFAGFAVQAGAKSVLASLWYVSDEATLGLMTEFYQQLRSTSVKTEALRQAQLAMIKGQVQIESGKLLTNQTPVPLPPVLADLGDQELTHPYYWAGFTMIGNPW